MNKKKTSSILPPLHITVYIALGLAVVDLLGLFFVLSAFGATEDTIAGKAIGGNPPLAVNQQCAWKFVEQSIATTGNKACLSDRVFRNCAFAVEQRINLYYSSTDGTCSGPLQLPYDSAALMDNSHYFSCSEPISKSSVGQCHAVPYPNNGLAVEVAEPIAGDVQQGESQVRVLCCK